MELIVLGCDGSYPGPNGATSGYLLDAGAAGRLLMDCGSGVLARLMARMDPADLRGILLTHWHNDHASDLLTLRYYLQIRKKKLILWAPGQPHPLRALCRGAEFDLRDLEDVCFDDLGVRVMPVNHPVPAYALRIEQAGKAFVYTGDATLTPGLDAFCEGADLLLCDATFSAAQWHERLPHMSAAMAAALARDASVGRLLLTHCPPGADAQGLLSEARQVFPKCEWARPLASYSP